MTEHNDRTDNGHSDTAERVLAANEALREDMHRLAEKLDAVSGRGDRTRLIVYALTVVTFMVAVGVLYGRSAENRRLIRQEENYLVQQCLFNNAFRVGERSLWEALLAEDAALARLEGTKVSPAEQAAIDRIQDKIERIYALKDCTQVKDGKFVLIDPSVPTPVPVP